MKIKNKEFVDAYKLFKEISEDGRASLGIPYLPAYSEMMIEVNQRGVMDDVEAMERFLREAYDRAAANMHPILRIRIRKLLGR